MKTILIIEDDQNIHEMLKTLLMQNGYEIKSAYSGTEALLVHDQTVDLIILDLMLPGKSGEEIICELKQIHDVPVIVTSALSDLDKKLNLFELGADDYVTKPFSNDELLARIKVHLRNNQKGEEEIIHAGDLELNRKMHQIVCNHINLNLSRIEFAILELLMKYKNQVVTKSMIFDTVWNTVDSADENTLNVHISKIRNKLKQANPDHDYIKTIWSIGYQLKI